MIGLNKKCASNLESVLFPSVEMMVIWATYRFSLFCDFSVRVFSSTPKNKRVFAGLRSFGRKFAKNKRLLQFVECQWLMFEDNSFVLR